MNKLALILAIVVIGLTFRPVASYVLSGSTSCCAQETTCVIDVDPSHDDQEHKDCDGHDCLPFQSCCNAPVLVPFMELDLSYQASTDYVANFNLSSLIPHRLAQEYWQPPRLV